MRVICLDFLVINDNELVRGFEEESIEYDVRKENDKIVGEITVKEDTDFSLCFLLHQEEVQKLDFKIRVLENVNATLVMNCAIIEGEHNSNFKIILEKNSKLKMIERHFHGLEEIRVNAKTCVEIKENAVYDTQFDLVKGRGGRVNYFLCSNLDKNARINSLFKGIFIKHDVVEVNENVRLIGENSSAMLKTKTVGRESARINYEGKIIGEGNNSKGHIDCSEIVTDNAVAVSKPELEVINETARLTHEAAVGKIEEEKIKLLMAKGLTKEQAINKIIVGLLE